MIQFLWPLDKTFSQKIYDKKISKIDFNNLTCASCGLAGHCGAHGTYKRSIITGAEKETAKIQRVKCRHCGKTHALLPTCIVPYSQIVLADHIKILRFHIKRASANTISKSNSYKKSIIGVTNIQYIIKQFKKYWKKRLLALALKLPANIDQFVKSCFDKYKRQFMQIKRTPNVFYFLNN